MEVERSEHEQSDETSGGRKRPLMDMTQEEYVETLEMIETALEKARVLYEQQAPAQSSPVTRAIHLGAGGYYLLHALELVLDVLWQVPQEEQRAEETRPSRLWPAWNERIIKA